MIDTHVHLDLIDDAAPALAAAVRAGVTDVIAIGVDPRVPSLAKAPLPPELRVHHALGLHPQALGDLTSDDALQSALTLLAQRLEAERSNPASSNTRVVAVGETGLDARANMPDADVQQRAFSAQLAMAREHDLPVVLHGVRRDAAMLAALDRELARPVDAPGGRASLRAVWHGFSSSRDTMREAVARGAFISIGFMALNDKARRVLEAIPHIPADRLLVETDAPPLAPEKLADVIARVAELRGTTTDEIVRLTCANATRFFGLT